MKLVHIEIENVKSIDYLNFDVAPINVITGDNGVGKSSLLDAVADIFAGGHQPELIRNGKDKCITRLNVKDKEGVVYTITKWHTDRSYDLNVTASDGRKIKREKEFVEALAKGFALDPLGIITAKPSERAQYFLKILNLSFKPEEVNQAMSVQGDTYTDCRREISMSEFEVLVHGQEEERTDKNRTLRDLQGTQRELSGTLPKTDETTDWAARLETLQSSRRDLQSAMQSFGKQAQVDIAEAVRLIETATAAEVLKARGESNDRVAVIKDEINALNLKIQALRRDVEAEDTKLENTIVSLGNSKREKIEKLQSDKRAEMAPTLEEFKSKIAQCDSDIMLANERKEQADKHSGVVAAIKKIDSQMAPLQRRANELDKIIDNLRALRLAKLESLPIPGVQVKNGDLVVNGVPWEHVNTAEQIRIAIKAGRLSFGSMPLMVTDKGEHLTPEAFSELMAELEADGVQVIAARVGHKGEGLRVERAA